jgi:hypothetical protein
VNVIVVVPSFVTVNICEVPPARLTVPKLMLDGVKINAGAEEEAKFATTT